LSVDLCGLVLVDEAAEYRSSFDPPVGQIDDPVGLGGQKLTSGRAVPPGRGIDAGLFKIFHTVEWAILWPSRASSPWIRRCPHPGFSLAVATTNLVIDALVCGRPARARDG
jgi:hypothetical protein